jgi:hypothetical protein
VHRRPTRRRAVPRGRRPSAPGVRARLATAGPDGVQVQHVHTAEPVAVVPVDPGQQRHHESGDEARWRLGAAGTGGRLLDEHGSNPFDGRRWSKRCGVERSRGSAAGRVADCRPGWISPPLDQPAADRSRRSDRRCRASPATTTPPECFGCGVPIAAAGAVVSALGSCSRPHGKIHLSSAAAQTLSRWLVSFAWRSPGSAGWRGMIGG